MNFIVQNIIHQKSRESSISEEELYKHGMKYVIDNIEFYFDKPYSCESVLLELFERGIHTFIQQTNQSR
jgi:hypothetical protein